jgi:hypothetical protein
MNFYLFSLQFKLSIIYQYAKQTDKNCGDHF